MGTLKEIEEQVLPAIRAAHDKDIEQRDWFYAHFEKLRKESKEEEDDANSITASGEELSTQHHQCRATQQVICNNCTKCKKELEELKKKRDETKSKCAAPSCAV